MLDAHLHLGVTVRAVDTMRTEAQQCLETTFSKTRAMRATGATDMAQAGSTIRALSVIGAVGITIVLAIIGAAGASEMGGTVRA